MVENRLPADNDDVRRRLYGGSIFLVDPTSASRDLVQATLALLHEEMPSSGEDVRHIPARLAPDDFFQRMGRIRRRLFLDPIYHQAVRDVIDAGGFDLSAVAFDPVKLRVVSHRGHENPRAAAVYYPHRDTWYGHPQGMITWWIPLHDTPAEETFVFHPGMFDRSVPNDSEIFDYADWVRDGPDLRIGWQNRDAGTTARYPGVQGEVDAGPAEGFSCRSGQNLLFSGSHFHRTLPHTSGRTRFSLDFRLVHLDDHANGRGAPNADNRSRGSALPDYIQP